MERQARQAQHVDTMSALLRQSKWSRQRSGSPLIQYLLLHLDTLLTISAESSEERFDLQIPETPTPSKMEANATNDVASV